MMLFDIDVCVELLRGNNTVIERRQQTADRIAVSFMTAAELYFGAYKSGNLTENRDVVEKFLNTVEIHQSTLRIADKFGEIKESLQKSGQSLADADIFIAATALCNNEILVTGNVQHYQRIDGLRIENWLKV